MRDLTFKQRQEMEAKRKEAERKALKDEILAELHAAGMLKAPSKGGNKKGEKTDAPAEK
jgi:hypothetical protein